MTEYEAIDRLREMQIVNVCMSTDFPDKAITLHKAIELAVDALKGLSCEGCDLEHHQVGEVCDHCKRGGVLEDRYQRTVEVKEVKDFDFKIDEVDR